MNTTTTAPADAGTRVNETDRDGNLVTMELCYDLDTESGRWEPFWSIVDRVTR